MEIKAVSGGGKKVNAHFGGFTVKTDQSKEHGGDGSAPEPFQLFLSSIATCAGINIFAFCQKRDIPVEDMEVILRDTQNPITKMRDRISLEIKLPPTFPEKYKNVVIRAAETCAVKKHLSDSIQFETTITA